MVIYTFDCLFNLTSTQFYEKNHIFLPAVPYWRLEQHNDGANHLEDFGRVGRTHRKRLGSQHHLVLD